MINSATRPPLLALRPYLLAQFLSATARSVMLLSTTFAVLEKENGPASLGIVLAAETIPTILLVLVGGTLGDKWTRRTTLAASDGAMAISALIICGLVLMSAATVPAFVGAQLLSGAAMSVAGPTGSAMVVELVNEKNLSRANALLRTCWSIAGIGGPAVGGAVVTLFSPAAGFVLAACCFIISTVLFASLPKSVAAASTVRIRLLQEFLIGWRELRRLPWALKFISSAAVYQATVMPVLLVLGPALNLMYERTAAQWSFILISRALGGLIMGVVLLKWRPQRPLFLANAALLLDVPFLVWLALGGDMVGAVIFAMLSSGGLVTADTLWESTLQASVPASAVARVTSWDWLGSLAFYPLGFALAGLLAQSAGVIPVVLTVACVHLVLRMCIGIAPDVRTYRSPA